MARVTGEWIEAEPTQAVMRMLTEAGHQAWFVGGCVRNALIGAGVSDMDIATDARPEEVMRLAGEAGLKPVPTGVEHGTVTVVSDHVPHEITTFRSDVETDGRRAVVAFSDTVEEDARRRDFTMNALYAAADGEVFDPLGKGLADLQARRVRFIDDAGTRIREDYLRILRFFRFHAWYGDPGAGLDPEGLAACAANSAGIETLSAERVGAEMVKLLAAPDPAPAVAAMAQSGILQCVLPGAEAHVLAPLVHLEGDLGAAPDAIRRLAALGGEEARDRLRLSRARARRLERLMEWTAKPTGAAELGYRLGAAEALDVLLLRAAALGQPLSADSAPEAQRGAAAEFPVRATDLMPDYQGAALGRKLSDLESRWIASGFTMTRAALLS